MENQDWTSAETADGVPYFTKRIQVGGAVITICMDAFGTQFE